MGYWAELDSNKRVKRVIIADSKYIATLEGRWVETFSRYKDFAGKGYEYNPVYKVFKSPQPFGSWKYDYRAKEWKAPVDMPIISKVSDVSFTWDEEEGTWEVLRKLDEIT